MTDVLTYHNDVGRTGQTLHEQVLTLANVNVNHFGKLWTLHTDEKSYAQPLYAAGVRIPGSGLRNVVFVATEGDSVYAFNADGTNLLWEAFLCASNEIPFQFTNCSIVPEIGITSTPVIDRAEGPNGTIYIVAASQDASGICFQRLHALDLSTGKDRLSPVMISGVYPGSGDDSTNGLDYFVASHYVNRAALLLLKGVVYVTWSAHCNSRPATSWIMGYDEHTLSRRYVLNLEPNSYWGSIWNSGGPAADSEGNLYIALGNGGVRDWRSGFSPDGFPNDKDYGCCLVKLAITNSQLRLVDYFAPFDIAYQSYLDEDLGSSCPVVLPDLADSNGVARKLVIVSGKNEDIYLADRTNLGKCHSTYNALYQELDNIFPGPPDSVNHGRPDNYGRSGGMWSVPAYFNGVMYFGPVRNNVMALPFRRARLDSIASSRSRGTNGYPGATPTISANGTSNAILWTVECLDDTAIHEAQGAVLHAYDATNLADEIYNTLQASHERDRLGLGQKFSTPMVASGRVYVLSSNSVVVYGLLDALSLTPIQRWRADHFRNPSNVGAGADEATPAGDGVPNIDKYRLSLDPFIPLPHHKSPRAH